MIEYLNLFKQVRVLLDRVHAVSKLWDDAPVVLCGDFNCTPKVGLIFFISLFLYIGALLFSSNLMVVLLFPVCYCVYVNFYANSLYCLVAESTIQFYIRASGKILLHLLPYAVSYL